MLEWVLQRMEIEKSDTRGGKFLSLSLSLFLSYFKSKTLKGEKRKELSQVNNNKERV
jgi:hypothetical protein